MGVQVRKCLRCEHEWALRKPEGGEPALCPKCGTSRWNKPKPKEDKANESL